MNARREGREATGANEAEQGTAEVRVPHQDRRATTRENQGRVRDPVADEQAARDWESHKPELSDGRGVVRGYHRQGGSWAPTSSHRGLPSSWIAVVLGTVGFLLCGLSLILVWTIPLLIAGGILMVAAAAIALFYDILTDVVVDAPREETEEAYETPLHRLKMKARQRREDRKG